MKPAFNHSTTFSTQLEDWPEQSTFEFAQFAEFANAQSAGPLGRNLDGMQSAPSPDSRASHAIDVRGRR